MAELGPFRLITRGDELPVFAFTTAHIASYNVFDVSRRRCARAGGWCRRTHSPQTAQTSRCCGSWCATGFSHDMADLLLGDLARALPELERQPGPRRSAADASSFHH